MRSPHTKLHQKFDKILSLTNDFVVVGLLERPTWREKDLLQVFLPCVSISYKWFESHVFPFPVCVCVFFCLLCQFFQYQYATSIKIWSTYSIEICIIISKITYCRYMHMTDRNDGRNTRNFLIEIVHEPMNTHEAMPSIHYRWIHICTHADAKRERGTKREEIIRVIIYTIPLSIWSRVSAWKKLHHANWTKGKFNSTTNICDAYRIWREWDRERKKNRHAGAREWWRKTMVSAWLKKILF